MRVWKRTKHYWYEFTFGGRRIRASSKQGDKEAAKNIGAAHRTRLAQGRFDLNKPKRVTIGELLDRVKKSYELDGKLGPQNISLLKRARADFGTKMADELTAEHLVNYVEKRISEGYAPATINRTTEIVRRAYRLARLAAPHITRLEEKNARQGFFTREEFDRVLVFLPDDLKDLVSFAHITGMRSREVKSLAWADVTENMIRLRGENAKTGKPRSLAIAGPLVPLMERRRSARAVKSAEGVRMSSTIFHRNGNPVGEFKKSWATACVAAGVGKMTCPKCEGEGTARWCVRCKTSTRYRGRIFHDLRRCGVRNLIRAGVPQTVAMSISGHRTVSVFHRYDIVDDTDLANAMKKLEAFGQMAEQPSNLAQISR